MEPQVVDLEKWAKEKDPRLMRYLKQAFTSPCPPISSSNDNDVLARGWEIVEAFRHFADYLRPYKGGQQELEYRFTGLSQVDTWKHIFRWMSWLAEWGPTFRFVHKDMQRPPIFSEGSWDEEIAGRICNFLFNLGTYHRYQQLLSLARAEEGVGIICRRLLLATAGMGKIVPAVGRAFLALYGNQLQDFDYIFPECVAEFLAIPEHDNAMPVMVNCLASLMRKRRFLDCVDEVLCLVVVMVKMLPHRRGEALTRHWSYWMAKIVSSCVAATTRGCTDRAGRLCPTNVLRAILLMGIRFLAEVAHIPGSTGWVIEAIGGGVLRGIARIDALFIAEKRHEERINYEHLDAALLLEVRELLAIYQCHLLSPCILRRVLPILQRELEYDGDGARLWHDWKSRALHVATIRAIVSVKDHALKMKTVPVHAAVVCIMHIAQNSALVRAGKPIKRVADIGRRRKRVSANRHFGLQWQDLTAVIEGSHAMKYVDKGFIRYVVHMVLKRRERELTAIRERLTVNDCVQVNLTDPNGKLLIIPFDEVPEAAFTYYPSKPLDGSGAQLIMILCGAQNMVVWTWYRKEDPMPPIIH
ncbi:hypothetical protein VNI00_018842 [Paramarasmius palmivorus]|uniref:Uncharacterized protein n=1 Tax=Paramarasmius palmivorus TaxID=297713 RepID=A0AAW0ATG0_9AGAR